MLNFRLKYQESGSMFIDLSNHCSTSNCGDWWEGISVKGWNIFYCISSAKDWCNCIWVHVWSVKFYKWCKWTSREHPGNFFSSFGRPSNCASWKWSTSPAACFGMYFKGSQSKISFTHHSTRDRSWNNWILN